jgi:hypothetical protein
MSNLTDDEVKQMKDQATKDVKDALDQLEKDYPGASEGLAAVVGATGGGASSTTALYFAGAKGFSASGITSGLAAIGRLVGGGMTAGVALLAVPVAALAVGAYAVTKQRKSARLATALRTAIAKIYAVQERLLQNAEYFKEELAGIKATIEVLQRKKPA